MLVRSGKLRDKIREKVKKNGIVQRSSQPYSWVQQHGSESGGVGYVTSSAFAGLVAAGAETRSAKKRRTMVFVEGRGWVYVSRRGSRRRKGVRVLRREQAGRGGIQARPFVFVDEDQLVQVQEMILAFLVEAFGEEATRGPA